MYKKNKTEILFDRGLIDPKQYITIHHFKPTPVQIHQARAEHISIQQFPNQHMGQDVGRLHLLIPTQAGTSAIPPGTQHCY